MELGSEEKAKKASFKIVCLMMRECELDPLAPMSTTLEYGGSTRVSYASSVVVGSHLVLASIDTIDSVPRAMYASWLSHMYVVVAGSPSSTRKA